MTEEKPDARTCFLIPLLAARRLRAVEPTGGAPMALVNRAGQSIGTVRAWQTAGGVSSTSTPPGCRTGSTASTSMRSAAATRPISPAPGRTGTRRAAAWVQQSRGAPCRRPAQRHVAANGVLGEAVTIPGASIASLIDADGAALVIHAAADDYMADPSGNSGARIACAVIRPGAQIL